jgi:TatA/E family protein of Tat protein translocase
VFGSLGGPELIFILVLALLLFGPRKLPQIGRAVGRTMGELRKATNEFRSTLEREIDVEEVKAARRDLDTATGGITEVVDDLARVARRPHTLLTEESGSEAEKGPSEESVETEPRS